MHLLSLCTAVHARQVCHGDLKAQNVLMAALNPPTDPDTPATGPWVAKVADFGLSRALKDDETHRSTRTTGTVTHMPPELLRSGKLMPAGDVYAFGGWGRGLREECGACLRSVSAAVAA